MVLKYQDPPFHWNQAHTHVCLTEFRSRIGLDEILSLESKRKAQEPGSHRPPSRVDGAMQAQFSKLFSRWSTEQVGAGELLAVLSM